MGCVGAPAPTVSGAPTPELADRARRAEAMLKAIKTKNHRTRVGAHGAAALALCPTARIRQYESAEGGRGGEARGPLRASGLLEVRCCATHSLLTAALEPHCGSGSW